jgi:nucleotide-binding universal stress UspA family protein
MQQFKNILVAIDTKADNRAVRDRAIAQAQKNQACLTVVTVLKEWVRDTAMLIAPASEIVQVPLLNVIEELPPDKTEQQLQEPLVVAPAKIIERNAANAVPKILANLHEDIMRDEGQLLEQFVEPIQQKGIQVSTKVLFGSPFLEIIREVVRNQHDLVMITATGGGLRKRLFGSTTMQLMRQCPCPVWVIKSTEFRAYRRIIAAVDPDPFDPTRDALNSQIIELAAAMATQEQSELLIFHAWTVYGEETLRGGLSHMPAWEVDRHVQEVRADHLRRLAALLAKHPLTGIPHQIYMLKGEAGRLLPELVNRKEADLIVMGTVCRTGVAGFLIGNTAESISQQVDCSVLAVKPEGFVTPIRLEDLQAEVLS